MSNTTENRIHLVNKDIRCINNNLRLNSQQSFTIMLSVVVYLQLFGIEGSWCMLKPMVGLMLCNAKASIPKTIVSMRTKNEEWNI